jgi:hypothetical protein
MPHTLEKYVAFAFGGNGVRLGASDIVCMKGQTILT